MTRMGSLRLAMVAGLVVVWLMAVSSGTASAQVLIIPGTTFTVNTNDDVDNGACTTSHCSFREALNAANANTGSGFHIDHIVFQIASDQTLSIHLNSILPTVTDAVTINGDNQPIQSFIIVNGQRIPITIAHPGKVEVSGTGLLNGNGLTLNTSGGTTVSNLQMTGFPLSGFILNSSDNVLIGVVSSANKNNGVFIPPTSNGNTVRDSTVTNNGGQGVLVNGNQNIVRGNTITGNTRNGVQLNGDNNTVGGTTTAERNVISGNGSSGVFVTTSADGNKISGNFVGLTADGTAALGNARHGIELQVSTNTVTIGGTTSGERNVISGNGLTGVSVQFSPYLRPFVVAGPPSVFITGNFVGTNAAGTAAVPNTGAGVDLFTLQVPPTDNILNSGVVGGTAAGAGNVISGNLHDGILLRSPNDQVLGNRIGTDASGTLPLGNKANGIQVRVDTTSGPDLFGFGGNALIGINANESDPQASEANTIANNSGDGVLAFRFSCTLAIGLCATNAPPSATVRGNRFSGNFSLGIDYRTSSIEPPVTLNDQGDLNAPPNFPIISSASATSTTLTLSGVQDGPNNTGPTLDFYASPTCDPSGFGEGATYLGSRFLLVQTGNGGNFFFQFTLAQPLPAGTVITATATGAGFHGGTSEFSPCAAVTDGSTGVAALSPSTLDAQPLQTVTYRLTWTVPAPHVWRNLATLDLRVRDIDTNDTLISVHWDEASNTFRLFNSASGKFGPPGQPGDPNVLADRGVQLHLADSTVVGSGPTGPSVTLTLSLSLGPQTQGHRFLVEAAGADDFGNQAGFAPVGTLDVQ